MIRVFAVLAFFLQASAYAADAAADITGHWLGHYTYVTKKKDNVNFHIELKQKADHLSGKVTEPNSFDTSPVKTLRADLRGKVAADGKLTFVKTYDGTGGFSHSVNYEGTISKDGQTITGQWHLLQAYGNFVMERQK